MSAHRVIVGTLTGQRARDIGQDHNLGGAPVIKADANKPRFFESGYASGHADEILKVAGVAPMLEGHPSALSGWALIQWNDCQSFVFLARSFQHEADFYRMDN